MTHILLNLPEEYQTFFLNTRRLTRYDKDHSLPIERSRDKFSVKFYLMKKQSIPRTSIEDEKHLYVKSQYKITCTTCGKYGHKGKY